MRVRFYLGVALFILAGVAYAQVSTVLPEDFLRPWDPVTVVFEDAPGPARGGPADDPGDLMRISPRHAGEYRWLDEQTLQFFPADPWPPLQSIRITSRGSEFVRQTLMAPPTNVRPSSGSRNLDPVSRITFSLTQFVDPDLLAELVTIELRPLPGLQGQSVETRTADDFTLRVQDPSGEGEPVQATLTLREPIPYGTEATLRFAVTDSGLSAATLARYSFSTRPQFTLRSFGAQNITLPVTEQGSRYSLDQAISLRNSSQRLFLQFSENLGDIGLEEVRRLVSFEPAVRNVRYDVQGNRLYIRVDADQESPYRVNVSHRPILSSAERVLAPFAESSFFFYVAQQSSFVRWDRGEAILELNGPQLFPMEARATEELDLRFYRIDPLDRRFWPFPGNGLEVSEDRRPPMPGESISEMSREVQALGSPDLSRIVELPTTLSSPTTSFGLNLLPFFEEINGERNPGTYLMGYRALGSSSTRHYVRVHVTDLSLSVVEEEAAIQFAVTSLATGLPVADAEVLVEAQYGSVTRAVVSGRTDPEGQFRYDHVTPVASSLLSDGRRASGSIDRIIIRKDDDSLIFDADNPPPTFASYRSGSGRRWLSWLFSEPVTRRSEARTRGYLITERPIYRPEETVHLFGMIRQRLQGRIIRAPQNVPWELEIQGPGRRSWTFDLETDDFDVFAVDFADDELATGQYRAVLRQQNDRVTLAETSFQVEAYRIPRFEVQIHSDDRVSIDAPFNVELTAEFFAGGRVIGRPVEWRVSEFQYRIGATDFPGFQFSSYETLGGPARSQTGSNIVRQDQTDETGLALLRIDPTTRQNASPVRYLIEGTVYGADGQAVTATRSIVALPPFSVGISQERFVRSSMVLEPRLVVVDFNGNPVADQEFVLRLYQRQWHSYLAETDFVTGEAEYFSDVVDELILEERIVSTDDIMQLRYPIDESGVYVFELLARDNQGRLQRLTVDTYVPGTDPVAWRRVEGNVFETTVDQNSYRPGETARILLQSPYQTATALAVIEEPSNIRYEWVEITGGQGILNVPIWSNMVPRVPVHFLLMRGRVEGTAGNAGPAHDRGRPITVANTTFLNVRSVEQELLVDLDYPEQSEPGSTITIDIDVEDFAGRPADGQVALWLVDRAVLTLAEEGEIEPLGRFIDPVDPSVTIRDVRNQVIGNVPFQENPGGGGGFDRAAEESLLDRATVRENFQTVPFYDPRIPVENGSAQVEVTLPDNLTDFAVRAVIVSGTDRFASYRGSLSVRLPVIVQTALPRFVRPGDAFEAGAVARIVEGPSGAASVEVRTEGLEVEEATTRRVELAQGESSEQFFSFTVPDDRSATEVGITIGIERIADRAGDAFRVELPVIPGVFQETRAAVQHSTRGAQTLFPEAENPAPGTVSQQLVVTLDEELVYLLSGLRYLERLEAQSTEQWLSSLRPLLQLQQILEDVNWDRSVRLSQAAFEAFLDHIDRVRDANGLYAQFPGGRGLVSLTAWILDFFVLAREAGFDPGDDRFTSTVRTLQAALRSDYRNFISDYSFQERVEALTALSRAGRFDRSYAESLLNSAIQQNYYSGARLVDAYYTSETSGGERLDRLVDHLRDAATFRLENGERRFVGLSFPASFRHGGYLMMSEERSLAAVIKSLAIADPEDELIPPMLDYLFRQSTDLGWGSSAATIQAMDTIYHIVTNAPTQSLPNIRFTLRFGDETLRLETERRSVTGYRSARQEQGVVVQEGAGEPYLYLETSYFPAGSGREVAARNDGFAVNRELQRIVDNEVVARYPAIREEITFSKGDVIEERITVSNPEMRHYVAIHVPLAAGFEPLNPELEISGPEARPLGRTTRTPSYVQFLDDKVVYYYEELPSGTYQFHFRVRALFNGSFTLPPAWAEALYDVNAWGNSDGALVRIIDGEGE